MLTCLAGFLLAANGHLYAWHLLTTLLGTALVIASACVCNNYIDQNIDQHMARTQRRALVTGLIGQRGALVYAAILGCLGLFLLYAGVNHLTAAIGLFGFISYVGLYSFAKRQSTHGTLVGTISGATPPVAGYVAVTNHFDSGALLLFLILVCWQMPHFYAIALYRAKDYKAAGIPVLPVIKGVARTKTEITVYILAFILACWLLTIYGYTGYAFATIMSVMGLVWLGKGRASVDSDSIAWGRRMFFFSIIILPIFSLSLALNSWLP